jgi:ribonucleoside-diphosphate reductase alpha chain
MRRELIRESMELKMREKLLRDRYLQPGENCEQDMYHRVAKFISQGDDKYEDELFRAMDQGYWLPNTPTLVNAGTNSGGGLSACYVLPIEDSLDGIYKTVWDAAKVHKAFGGTGFNFSHIRGKGFPIKSTGGKACGPIKVMELLNMSAGVVSQGGKREGANMGILNSDHPDIHEFIRCKDTDDTLTHFNISVGLYDRDLTDNPGLISEIAEHAWRTGDPGVVFLDRLSDSNLRPDIGPIDCTNPCGEIALRAYESCNLASINLSKLVGDGGFKYGLFDDYIELSVRALNDIIDLNTYPIPEIEKATKLTRKIGSGIMGWADALVMLGISYQSEEAINLIHHIGKQYIESAKSFAELHHNETVLTIAPTGTLSYLAGCSWGIEPIYDWEYTRESESGIDVVKSNLLKKALHDRIADESLSKNISYEWQIKHQATWQKYVDNSISKTINFQASATVKDVEDAIRLAWKSGCKGITVYRDGSKQKQVITSKTQSEIKGAENVSEVVSHRKKFPTGCGNIRVDCAELPQCPNVPYEVIVLTSGGCKANNAFTGKLISKYIHDPRLEGKEIDTIKRICETAHTITCDTAILNKKSAGKSCADIIAKYMEQRWLHRTIDQQICPQCGAILTFGKGCRNGTCVQCNWSGCQ